MACFDWGPERTPEGGVETIKERRGHAFGQGEFDTLLQPTSNVFHANAVQCPVKYFNKHKYTAGCWRTECHSASVYNLESRFRELNRCPSCSRRESSLFASVRLQHFRYCRPSQHTLVFKSKNTPNLRYDMCVVFSSAGEHWMSTSSCHGPASSITSFPAPAVRWSGIAVTGAFSRPCLSDCLRFQRTASPARACQRRPHAVRCFTKGISRKLDIYPSRMDRDRELAQGSPLSTIQCPPRVRCRIAKVLFDKR